MRNIFLMALKQIPISVGLFKNAYDQGARWVVLCDTNGGTLPHEVGELFLKFQKLYLEKT